MEVLVTVAWVGRVGTRLQISKNLTTEEWAKWPALIRAEPPATPP